MGYAGNLASYWCVHFLLFVGNVENGTKGRDTNLAGKCPKKQFVFFWQATCCEKYFSGLLVPSVQTGRKLYDKLTKHRKHLMINGW